jgi:hypothetical protein
MTTAHTTPVTIEMGTPIQKPQPAQLASHHDISRPNTVTAPTIIKPATYSNCTRVGPSRRSKRTSRRSNGDHRAVGGGESGRGFDAYGEALTVVRSMPRMTFEVPPACPKRAPDSGDQGGITGKTITRKRSSPRQR